MSGLAWAGIVALIAFNLWVLAEIVDVIGRASRGERVVLAFFALMVAGAVALIAYVPIAVERSS